MKRLLLVAFLGLIAVIARPVLGSASAHFRHPSTPTNSQQTAPPTPPEKKITAYTLPPDLYRKAHTLGKVDFWGGLAAVLYGWIILWLVLRWQLAPQYRNWAEKAAYDAQAKKLAQLFFDNFKRFEAQASDAVKAIAIKPHA